MKFRNIIFLLLLVSLVAGCATPKAVKQLSNEIVIINKSYNQSLTNYFLIIEQFVDAQVQLANYKLDQSFKSLNASYKELALMDLKEKDANHDAILTSFEKSVNLNTTKTKGYKDQLAELSSQLKLKNKELLSIQANIIQAQAKLNEYVQLEKADEAIFNELLGVVGIEKGNLTNTMGDITNIYTKINTLGESILKK